MKKVYFILFCVYGFFSILFLLSAILNIEIKNPRDLLFWASGGWLMCSFIFWNLYSEKLIFICDHDKKTKRNN